MTYLELRDMPKKRKKTTTTKKAIKLYQAHVSYKKTAKKRHQFLSFYKLNYVNNNPINTVFIVINWLREVN